VLYAAASAHCRLRFSFGKRATRDELREVGLKKATNVEEKLKEIIEPLADDADLVPFLKGFEPPGTVVSEYQLGGRDFGVYKLDMEKKAARDLLDRLEPLVLFFIDGGSTIDSTDPSWEPFVVYEMADKHPAQLVGFTTLYRFYAYPEHERLRLSQFLILPPFQKCGHGSRLLHVLHNEALRRPKCISLTVEDASPDLQHIRNKMYLEQLRMLKLDESAIPDIALLQKELKIPKIQARKLVEMMQLGRLDKSDEMKYTQYRLAVKRRLDKHHKEEISYDDAGEELPAEEKKKKLHQLYLSCEESYSKLLRVQSAS